MLSLGITQTSAAPSKRGPTRAPIIVRDYSDPDNRTERSFHDEHEATAHRLKLENLALAKAGANGKLETVREIVEEMLTNMVGRLRPNTILAKRSLLSVILGRFGDVPLATLHPKELAAFLKEIRAQDKPRRSRTARSTQIWSIFRAVFVYARDTARITYDPMDDVPVSRLKPKRNRGPLRMPSADQVKVMLTKPCPHLLKALAVSILLGTRVGETLGLNREDYSGDDTSFFVFKQRDSDQVKTESSYRYAPVVERLAKILGIEGDGTDFASRSGPLLVNAKGERWKYTELQWAFYKWQAEMGWAYKNESRCFKNHVTIHQLRHAFVAIALWSGAPIGAIAAAMGHKTSTQTEETYAYLIAEKAAELETWGVAAPGSK